MKRAAATLLLVLALAGSASALRKGVYEVQVSRIDDNLYRIDGTDTIVKTSMCLELALADDAILVWKYPGSWDNKLVFLDAEAFCRIEAIK